ncbi:MAG: putative hydrolase [Propionibacteriaceae bacterium]|nr:putative hydrolase [Propionibacteriaceae bacterium]
MKFTVVGSSGSVSGPDSPASSYLVQAPYEHRTFTLVLDLGPGAFGALYKYLDPSRVDAFGFSHLHPDHCFDLCAYFIAARYSPTAPWPAQPVYGPPGTGQRIGRAYEVLQPDGGGESAKAISEHFDYRDWAASQQIGPFLVRTAEVDHPVRAYAIRVEETSGARGSLVYSGDTGPSDALTELASGVDLLVAEAAFLEGRNARGVHLTGRQAAETASRAAVGALVLTHIPPWHDPDQVKAQALPHYTGPIALATPGATWSIGDPSRRAEALDDAGLGRRGSEIG